MIRPVVMVMGLLFAAWTFGWSQDKVDLHIQCTVNPDLTEFGIISVEFPGNWLPSSGDLSSAMVCLKVYVGSNIDSGQPAIRGEYWVDSPKIFFKPRYPPPGGITYNVQFDGERLNDLWPEARAKSGYTKVITFPAPTVHISTRVLTIFPNCDTVPTNLLKFYLHFSAPMGYDNPVDHIKLCTGAGQPIDDAWVEVKEGLWSPDRKRLTLFIHPGRIKRQVGPNQIIGPVLVPLHKYALVIDSTFRDAEGLPLVASHTFQFDVREADRTPINPAMWKIFPPRSGSVEPLKLYCSEEIDQALAERLIIVLDENKRLYPGSAKYDNRSWTFTPDEVWTSKKYMIDISAKLEDLAGNTLNYTFDMNQSSNGAIVHIESNNYIMAFRPK